MDSETLIQVISNIVEEESRKDTNIFGYENWMYHVTYVVKYAKKLADILEADKEIVEIAALLHDYASIKDPVMFKSHHIFGAIEAEKILKTFNFPEEKIQRVKHCIIQHRGIDNIEITSKESECVANADAMANIDQVAALLYYAYTKREMSVEDGVKWVRDKIESSWNRLSQEAKEIIKDRYDSAKIVLESTIKDESLEDMIEAV